MKVGRHWVLIAFAWVGSGLALAADNVSTKSGHSTEKELVETPALPYLTLMLMRDPAVHRELRLDRKQVQRVEAVVAQVDQPFWVLRDVPVAKCEEKLDQYLMQLRQGLQESFSAAQRQRFDEIILQARGLKALVSHEVAHELKLSDEQVARIRTTLLSQPDGSAADGTKVATPASSKKNRRTSAQEVVDILSPEQSARLTQLAGRPFNLGRLVRIGCNAPELRGVDSWINTEPLTLEVQRGKVVAVHFWAFGCINCIRNLPHYQSWYEKFPQSQLTIVGIHTSETDREKSVDNLRQNVQERGIAYPVAFDAAAENWKAWGNYWWPSVYLIDKKGRVRYWWYGELNWQGAKGEEFMRKKIEELLAEN